MSPRDHENDKAEWVTIAITASLLLSMSAEVARAYLSADGAAAQQEVLQSALATGAAVPLVRAPDGSVGPPVRSPEEAGCFRIAGPSRDNWGD
jgi:hypothetical protein